MNKLNLVKNLHGNNEWSAKKSPFIVICENEEAKKLFYKEASIDPISDLFNYLNKN